MPIATGNGNDALLALLPDTGKFVVLRVPYPMGFYAKGMDGRIDDPNAGWKGKGLWATYGTRTPFHAEGGKGTTSKVLHFQLRPTHSRTRRLTRATNAFRITGKTPGNYRGSVAPRAPEEGKTPTLTSCKARRMVTPC